MSCLPIGEQRTLPYFDVFKPDVIPKTDERFSAVLPG